MAIDAKAAGAQVQATVSALNTRTRDARLKKRVDYEVYIYSISPIAYKREMGGMGTFTVPACEPGKAYSQPLVIQSPICEEYDAGNNRVKAEYFEGDDVAQNIVSPPTVGQDNNLINQGVFIAAGEIPTQAELAKAHESLRKTYVALITQADFYFDQGPKIAQNIDIRHHRACSELKQTRPWHQEVVAMVTCPGCGSDIKTGVVMHTCGAVLNWDKAIELGLKKPEDRPVKQ